MMKMQNLNIKSDQTNNNKLFRGAFFARCLLSLWNLQNNESFCFVYLQD